MGRPSKYKSKYCQALIDFFDVEPYEDIELPHYQKDGVTIHWKDYKRVPVKLPTLRDFAKSINVGISTVYDWINKQHASYHKKFSDAFTQAQDIRKWFMIQNGLQGLYNPVTFKFVAVNVTDMRDKQEHEHKGNIEHNISPELMALGKQMAEKYAQEAK